MNRYLYTKVYSIIIHNSQKLETTQASTDRWMDKENVVYTHSGLSFSISDTRYKWVKLKDTNPREISQSQKDKYGRIPPAWGTESSWIHRNRKWDGSCQGLREKEMQS